MFDTALRYFPGKPYYKAERARTLFKKSQFLQSQGDSDEAEELRHQAQHTLQELRSQGSGEMQSERRIPNVDSDFDAAVMIMS